jgi:hypothetical protein
MHFDHTVCFCVLYDPFNKYGLFMQAALTVFSSQWRRVLYCDMGSEFYSLLLCDVDEQEDLTRTLAFRYQNHSMPHEGSKYKVTVYV